jgi:MFS superfamily sulfate permease-like transporter
MAACVVLAAPAIGRIPVAALAGVMLVVAFSTVQV